MYSRALFPESRGDILGLLEAMDRIPNSAESVTRMLVDQHISIPREFSGELWELADLCGRLVEVVLDATRRLMGRFLHATQLLGKIDELESEADRIESRLIERIFAGKRDGYEKLLLRDLIQHIASISDRAQHVGDRINIIVAKRHI
jgi:predicted phosphate transport protein (TIGR00153 family)